MGLEVNVVHIVNVRVRVSHTLTLLSVCANLPLIVLITNLYIYGIMWYNIFMKIKYLSHIF